VPKRIVASWLAVVVGCSTPAPPKDISQPGAVAWVVAHAESVRVYQPKVEMFGLVPASRSLEAVGPILNREKVRLLRRLYQQPCPSHYAPTMCACTPAAIIRFSNRALSVEVTYCSDCGGSWVHGTGTAQAPRGDEGFSPCVLDSLAAFLRQEYPSLRG